MADTGGCGGQRIHGKGVWGTGKIREEAKKGAISTKSQPSSDHEGTS